MELKHEPNRAMEPDEHNEFVMNELIDPSSSDDEDDIFLDATHMITEDSINYPGQIGSVEGLLWHGLFYKKLFLR